MIPALLSCPRCKNRRDTVNLGSITSEGYIIIKQKFGRHVAILAEEYSVICDCGYLMRISNGKVTREAMLTQ